MNVYAYIYDHDGKEYYWYNDDVEGDVLVSDIEDASLFSEKQVNDCQLDTYFIIRSEIYVPELNEYIDLNTFPVRIKVN